MIKQTQKLIALHQDCLDEFNNIQAAVRNERLQCLQDRRFYSIAGAQWEGPIGLQFENKPRFEINKILKAVDRRVSEYRKNRISAVFIPKDGSSGDKMSDTLAGLYRADEKNSSAQDAYDNAFEESVGGGMGAWRLRAVYENDEDDDDDRQRVVFEPIVDADSCVFFSLNSKRYDKSDAKRCFVLTAMSRRAYEDEYDDNPASWPKAIHQLQFDWLTPDVVYVCEVYEQEKKKKLIHIFRGLDGTEKFIDDQDLELELPVLEATGFTEARQKTITHQAIHKYLMSGGGILEDCGIIAGRHIPIIMQYGKRWFIDNIERCSGIVRQCKDSQRLKNMQTSKLAEISALSSTEKPIFTPEQMMGHATMWSDDNIKNYPYLLLNPMTDQNGQQTAVGPIGYTKVPNIPPAMAALLQLTDADINDILGANEQLESTSPNQSGYALEQIYGNQDSQNYIYIDNFGKSMKRSGQVWLSMMKDIAVEQGRKMKIIDAEGKASSIELMRPVVNEESGEVELENDLANADFDVDVEIGPTSASRRSSTVRSLTSLMQITQDPDTLNVLSSMAIMNMEGEGISDVREYFRHKLITMGVIKPNKEELAQLQEAAQNQPPDPNAQLLESSAKQAEALANKALADTEQSLAKVENIKADTLSKLATLDIERSKHVLELMNAGDQENDKEGDSQGNISE